MPPIQNFRYTDHAEYQLFNRQVTKQAVERTVQYPDERQADKEDPEVTIAIRETSAGTFLKVWYRVIEDETIIQTALIITLRRERPQTTRKPRKGGKH